MAAKLTVIVAAKSNPLTELVSTIADIIMAVESCYGIDRMAYETVLRTEMPEWCRYAGFASFSTCFAKGMWDLAADSAHVQDFYQSFYIVNFRLSDDYMNSRIGMFEVNTALNDQILIDTGQITPSPVFTIDLGQEILMAFDPSEAASIVVAPQQNTAMNVDIFVPALNANQKMILSKTQREVTVAKVYSFMDVGLGGNTELEISIGAGSRPVVRQFINENSTQTIETIQPNVEDTLTVPSDVEATTTPTFTPVQEPILTPTSTSTPVQQPTRIPTSTPTAVMHGRTVYIPTGLTGCAGDEVEVPIMITDAEGVVGYRIAILFDTAQVTYVPQSIDRTDTLTSQCIEPQVNNNPSNRIIITGVCRTPLTGSGVLLKFRVRLNGNLEADSVVHLDMDSSISRLNDGRLSASFTDGAITPCSEDFIWGDVNCDEMAGTLDATEILQWDALIVDRLDCFSPPYVYPDFPPGGDVNADGVLGTMDASLILQYDALILEHFPADKNRDGFGPERSNKHAIADKQHDAMTPVLLSIPNDLRAEPGAAFDVPVLVDNAAGVTGCRLVILYDEAAVSFVPDSVDRTGTLSASFNEPQINTTLPGRLVISCAGLSPLGAERAANLSAFD